MQDFLLAIFVDPNPEAFTIPYFDISVRWYGILFALGFVLGYFALQKAFFRETQDKELSSFLIDRLLWFVMIGCVVGARLGHVLFYDLPYYIAHPLEVFNLRAGGLASHGGTVAVLFALYLYTRIYKKHFPALSFLGLVDLIVVPTALWAFFVRIGNFINQEILGNPTDLPWGIIFGHPAEGGGLIARHPVQLYEAFFYLFTFFLLNALKNRLKVGRLTGLFFLFVFGSRFLLEIFKEPQSHVFNENIFLAGQLLSIPFILLGLFLLFRPAKSAKTQLIKK